MGVHLINGKFQSDKYPTTPPGKVPLSVEDSTAQDLLWEYAQRRRRVDAEFADDLETALRAAGYRPLETYASLMASAAFKAIAVTALSLAERQLVGAVLDDAGMFEHCCTCQRCGHPFYPSDELDPCAFCIRCKDGVLDLLAEIVIKLAEQSAK